MTVCIAAICDNNMLIGMSDRLLTAGDVEFQPPTSKIWQLTNSIVLMVSGDINLQAEIHAAVMLVIQAHLDHSPDEWLKVEAVTQMYCNAYFEIKRRNAEQKILHPLGLDSSQFLARQQSMDPALVSKIAAELINFPMPGVSTIVAGNEPVDGTSDNVKPHIFIVNNGEATCADKVGFACVGAGAWHANSAMMMAGYNPSKAASRALLTVYAAKKRAEVAPGVGSETDNFVITPRKGGYSELRDEFWAGARKFYEAMIKQQARSLQKAEDSLHEYISAVIGKTATEQQGKPAEPAATH